MKLLLLTLLAIALSVAHFPARAQTKLDSGVILPKKHEKADAKPKAEDKKPAKKADKKAK